MFFTECKKYTEDPLISLKSPKKRLKALDWHFEKIVLNGNDITYLYNDSLAPRSSNDVIFNFSFDYYESGFLSDDGIDLLRVGTNIWSTGPTKSNFDIATWRQTLTKKKERICFGRPESFNEIKDTIADKILSNLLFGYWNIKKLWKKDLHIQLSKNNNNVYDIYFKN